MANQAKGNPWTDEETEALVNLWSDQNIQDALENYSVRKNVVYGKVSAALSEVGITRNAKQCCSKIKHLRDICNANFIRYFLLLRFFNKNKYINHNKIHGSAIL